MADNSDNNDSGEGAQSKLAACGKFLCNTEEGTFLGRTPKSWLLIGIFYLIYYALLAAFFVGMLSVLLYGIIKETEPMQTGDHSVLKMNPGLGMRPQPDITTTLIAYRASDIKSAEPHIKNLQAIYDEMLNSTGRDCNISKPEANKDFDPKVEFCKKDPSTLWGACQPPNFGYNSGSPCVIVKMNKIYGWLPDIADGAVSNHSLLDCAGENDADKVTIGQVDYYPSIKAANKTYGFYPSAFFPYVGQKGYGPNAVAVKFSSIKKNVLVMVECRLKNLNNAQYDKTDRQAMVRFEVLVKS